MHCKKCGHKLTGKEKFCPKCGEAVQQKSVSKKEREEYQEAGSRRNKGSRLKMAVAISVIIALLLVCIFILFFISDKRNVKKAADDAAEIFSNGDIEEINRLVFGLEETEAEQKFEELLGESDDGNGQEGILPSLFMKSTVSVKKVGQDSIEFKILSPDMEKVFQKLPDNSTEFSETDLAEYIDEYADNAEIKEFTVSVFYQKKDSEVVIDFRDEEFINAVTGGILDSYKQLYADAIAEYQEGGF